MKLEDIIAKLIENSHNIYNLYKELRKSIENKTSRKEIYKFFSFIEFLKQKEHKYLEMLSSSYSDKLNELYLTLRGSCAFYECKILENYIECSDNAVPLLRVLEKINDLIDEIYTPTPDVDEDGELLYSENNNSNNLQKPPAGYSSITEHIIESIFPNLEIESCVKFMNQANSFIEEITDEELIDKIKMIPYDITFLNPVLEDLFIKDNILNPSHKLFDTIIIYEDCYEEEMLNKAIKEDIINQLTKQIKELASKRKTNSKKKALLRAIYISSLYHILSEDEKDDLLVELKDIIEKIEYEFQIITILKEDADKIICHEITDIISQDEETEYEDDEYEKVKK